MSALLLVGALLFLLTCACIIAALVASAFKIGSGSFLQTLFGGGLIVGFIILVLSLSRMLPYSIMRVLYYVLGTIILLLIVAALYRLVYGFVHVLTSLSARDIMTSGIVLSVTATVWISLIGYAVWQFEKPHTITTLEFTSDAVDRSVRFVYFADTQYGSLSENDLQTIVTQINALDAEFVLFGGDRVDFDDYTVEGLGVLAGLDTPTYRVTGNHEYYHDVSRVESILEQIDGIELLDDTEVLLPGGVQVVGVDYRHASSEESYLATVAANRARDDAFSVFLFHEPKRVEETAQLGGYDIQLYGHTHAGQMFPGTLISRAVYGAYAFGKTVLDTSRSNSTTVYTTSGAGLFGPRMRLGTKNEIILVSVEKG